MKAGKALTPEGDGEPLETTKPRISSMMWVSGVEGWFQRCMGEGRLFVKVKRK